MKQTAVEWFNQQLVDKQNGKGDSRSLDKIFEQAKEMENEQQGYSEEEVWKLVNKLNQTLNIGSELTLEQWFELNKKK